MARNASADEQFEKLLSSYRSNYMQYIVTGQSSYKTAYEKIYNEIDQMIQARQQQVNNEKASASQFLNNFQQDNSEIADMRSKAQTMLEDVQQTRNQYQAAKSRYDNTDVLGSLSPANERGLGIVLRLGILLILIPIFFVLGYFYPTETRAPFVAAQQATQLIGSAAGAAAASSLQQLAATPGSPLARMLGSPRPAGFGSP